MPSDKLNNLILAVYDAVEKGAKKINMESDTHSVTGYKVGVVIRIDIKPKK